MLLFENLGVELLQQIAQFEDDFLGVIDSLLLHQRQLRPCIFTAFLALHSSALD